MTEVFERTMLDEKKAHCGFVGYDRAAEAEGEGRETKGRASVYLLFCVEARFHTPWIQCTEVKRGLKAGLRLRLGSTPAVLAIVKRFCSAESLLCRTPCDDWTDAV